jgi:hypothetical protein
MSRARNNWKVRRFKKEQGNPPKTKHEVMSEWGPIFDEAEKEFRAGTGIWKYIEIQNKDRKE